MLEGAEKSAVIEHEIPYSKDKSKYKASTSLKESKNKGFKVVKLYFKIKNINLVERFG